MAAAQELADQIGVELGSDAAVALLRGMEDQGPHCLIIEDAQWLDDESQRALWKVIRRISHLPVWVIVTSTQAQTFLLDGLGLLLRSPERGIVLEIDPMTPVEVAAFVHDRVGVPVRGELLTRIHDVTGGYPSLLVSLADQVRLGGNRAHLRSALHSVLGASRARGLMRHHVEAVWRRASRAQREGLVGLALAGELTGAQLAAYLRVRDVADVGLEELLDTGLIDRWGTDGARLRNQVSQQAIQDRATSQEVLDAHAGLAQTLGGVRSLAHHVAICTDAERDDLLADLGRQISLACLQRDYSLSYRLSLLAAKLDHRWTVDVILAVVRMGQLAHLSDLGHLMDDLPAGVTRTSTAAIRDLEAGGVREAVHRLGNLEVSPETHPHELIIVAHAIQFVATQAAKQGLPGLGQSFVPLVATLQESAAGLLADEPLLALELGINATALEMLIGHLLSADSSPSTRLGPFLEYREQMATRPGSSLLSPIADAMSGLLRYGAGDFPGAERDLNGLHIPALPLLTLQVALALASIRFLNGEWDEAHAIADEALATTLDMLQSSDWQQAFAVAALVPACRGEAQVVDRYLGWQDPDGAATLADASHKLALAWGLVSVGGDPAQVAGLLDKVWAAGMVRFTGAFTSCVIRVRAHLAAGNLSAARAARNELEAEEYEEEARRYAAAHCDALLAVADGSPEAARTHFARARSHLERQVGQNPRAGLRIFHALLAEDRAVAAVNGVDLGDHGLVDDLTRSAHLLQTCGAWDWHARLRALAAQVLTDEPSRIAPGAAAVATLTTREREIALLAARGRTNREIASELFVTVRTAEFHVHNALTKLGLRSRLELPAALHRDITVE